MLYEDRERAESFGANAELYDRVRPSYPPALVDELLGDGAQRVLDVGCGTGRASQLFMERGCQVRGVEPDRRMAEVARSHGVTVEDGAFETWDPRGRRFDLVISAQAWHWVDPVTGPRQAAAVLGPTGRIGLFWNVGSLPEELKRDLDAIYQQIAPGLDEYSVVLGNAGPDRYGSASASLKASGLFTEVVVRPFPHQRSYTTETWLEHLQTHSDHAALEPADQARLFEALGERIDREPGGQFTVDYNCWLVSARVAPS